MSQKDPEKSIIAPIEEQRTRTTLNLKKAHVEGLSKIAIGRKTTMTATIDEALFIALSEINKTTDIDRMLQTTNGFFFERDLAVVKQHFPTEKTKALIPYHLAYLYLHLKDQADRERVFEALALDDELKQINMMNAVLQKAAIFNKENVFKGYNPLIVANELRVKLSPLQEEYLCLKIGNAEFAKLKERRPDLFPQILNESNMNPALETILAVAQISRATWNAFPDDLKTQIHDAAKTGNIALAKKLVSQIEDDKEAVELFPDQEADQR